MWPGYSLLFSFLTQYLHPYKTRSYRKAVQAIRKIGRECIQRRISAIENGEQVPNDILTQIIRVTSELLSKYMMSHRLLHLIYDTLRPNGKDLCAK